MEDDSGEFESIHSHSARYWNDVTECDAVEMSMSGPTSTSKAIASIATTTINPILEIFTNKHQSQTT